MPQDFFAPPQGQTSGPPVLPPTQSAGTGADLLDAIMQAIVGASGLPSGIDTKASRVGELMGAAAPLMTAVKVLSKAPIRAFHGSPHDFDRFDLSKIGTGEGAQAYGHGLYFAENPQTAQAYRDTLSAPTPESPAFRLRGEPVALGTDRWRLAQLLEKPRAGETPADMVMRRIRELEDQARFAARAYGPDAATMYELQARELRRVDPADLTFHHPGRMYEVNIHADPETLLDWDRPLSQQGANVQQAVQRVMTDVQPVRLRDGSYSVTRVGRDGSGLVVREISEPTPDAAKQAYARFVLQGQGSDIYREVAKARATSGAFPEILVPRPQQASTALKDAGVPGIKYLDQGSRQSGEGTRNYVMFDDALIDILRKWGLLPAAVATGAAAAPQFRDRGQR